MTFDSNDNIGGPIGGLLKELRKQFNKLQEARSDQIIAKATSPQRTVAVEANAAGQIVSVAILDPAADPATLGAAITTCANQALAAAQRAGEERMLDFLGVQSDVVDNLSDRTGVNIADDVKRETSPPPIPDYLLTEEAYRKHLRDLSD